MIIAAHEQTAAQVLHGRWLTCIFATVLNQWPTVQGVPGNGWIITMLIASGTALYTSWLLGLEVVAMFAGQRLAHAQKAFTCACMAGLLTESE